MRCTLFISSFYALDTAGAEGLHTSLIGNDRLLNIQSRFPYISATENAVTDQVNSEVFWYLPFLHRNTKTGPKMGRFLYCSFFVFEIQSKFRNIAFQSGDNRVKYQIKVYITLP